MLFKEMCVSESVTLQSSTRSSQDDIYKDVFEQLTLVTLGDCRNEYAVNNDEIWTIAAKCVWILH